MQLQIQTSQRDPLELCWPGAEPEVGWLGEAMDVGTSGEDIITNDSFELEEVLDSPWYTKQLLLKQT